MFRTSIGLIGKSHHGTCRTWHTSPQCGLHLSFFRFVQWQSVLKRLTPVAQDIFAHISQIDIQITSLKHCIGVSQEWIHQPELDILNVCLLKIRIVQFTHDTTPTRFWVGQFTIATYLIRRNVIRTTLFWIVTQVQYWQTHIRIRQHFFVGVYLLFQYDTRTVIRHQIRIILDVLWCIALWITENRIHRVPCQQRTVLVIFRIVAYSLFWEHIRTRSRCQFPITWIVNIDIRFRCLKVIDICCTHLSHIFGMPWNQVCKLSIHLEGRRRSRSHPWHFIYQQGQPLQLRFPTCIHTPDSICQRFATRIHFGGQWLLFQVHNSSTYYQILVKLILQMGPI